MRQRIYLGLIVFLMLGLAACAPDSAGPATAPAETDATEAPAPTIDSEGGEEMAMTEEAAAPPAEALWDTEWILVGFGPNAEPLPDSLAGAVDLNIAEGTVSGHSGCNSFSGELTLTDTEFSSEMLAVTTMACLEEDRMQFENDYLQAFGDVTGWTLSDETLTLTADDISLVYQPRMPQPDAALEGSEWQFNGVGSGEGDTASVTSPVAGTTATLMLERGEVIGNTGCNSFSGSYALNGQSLSFSKLIHTMKACEEAVGSQEAAILTGLQNVASWAINGNQLRLDYPGGFLMYVLAE